MFKKNILLWIFPLTLIGCASQDESKLLLEKANEIHLEAIKINKVVQPKLEQLIQSKNQLEQQEEELIEAEESFMKKVAQLEKSYAFWEENHVEVPGFEHHDHDHHDHDHDHNHGATLEVSAEDMLLIQQEFKDSISVILERIEATTVPSTIQ
ncbi:MAG: hypothetical protein AAFO82_03210 [Bacteroidota bacterium]